jgi:hypothetical protein
MRKEQPHLNARTRKFVKIKYNLLMKIVQPVHGAKSFRMRPTNTKSRKMLALATNIPYRDSLHHNPFSKHLRAPFAQLPNIDFPEQKASSSLLR